MAVYIGQASIDENGNAHGGKAGNQNGRELNKRTYYTNKWLFVLRPTDSKVATQSVKACTAAVNNKHIGYDQYQRNTLRTQAKACNWDLSKITVDCETDCSALMTVCAEAAGVSIEYASGNAPTTYTMKARFTASGKYKALTESKYLTSSSYLKAGDILVSSGHTVMVLNDGSKAEVTPQATEVASQATEVASQATSKAKTTKTTKKNATQVAQYRAAMLKGTFKCTASALNLREGAGTNFPVICTIPKGTKVHCEGYYNVVNGVRWPFLWGTYNGIEFTAYATSQYLEKV